MAFKIVSESVSIFRLVFWLFSWFRTFVASWKSWKSIVKMGWFWTSAFLTWVLKSFKTSQKSIQKHKQKYYKKQLKTRSKNQYRFEYLPNQIFYDFQTCFGVQNGAKIPLKIDPKTWFEPWIAQSGLWGSILRPFWDHLGTIWGPFGPHVGTFWIFWAPFGTIGDHFGPHDSTFWNHLRPYGTIGVTMLQAALESPFRGSP